MRLDEWEKGESMNVDFNRRVIIYKLYKAGVSIENLMIATGYCRKSIQGIINSYEGYGYYGKKKAVEKLCAEFKELKVNFANKEFNTEIREELA